ncbi:fungal-specific transcription factor domain-containing protein [Chaetomidium leptoderma]|uniref:Fungal-specific transcription factor domain-containing protein n=1 Tax=Chaetomidium leptoderma TaxID=669021 RepID=A0AAN6VME8_9PEZI|nr:fungal-specific transcription factor domain-containing protein [Chaetomidium leptoderma]
MTPTPPSATTSSTGRSPEPQFRVVRKRNRVPLSCYPCRTRKKCDRSHPCSNCTRREGTDTLACSYAAPVSRRKNQSQGEPSPDDMQNRIDRLEGLVLSLMHGGANIDVPSLPGASSVSSGGAASNASPSTADTSSLPAKPEGHDDGAMQDDDESDIDDGLATSLGVLRVDPDRSKHVYLGEEHWHTILMGIAEVKNYFASHKKDLEKSFEKIKLAKPPTAKQPPTLLMGATAATEIELRAELPPKSTVLALCARYFNSMDNAANIIHPPTFHQQLRNHWQDPSKTPIMWLALLYSVLCMAMLSYQKIGDEPPEWKGRVLELANEYRLRTVQCLIAGDYTKPAQYTVEAMMLYCFCEYSTRWDADLGLWIIVSIVVRIALRMGYHRDGKWFPTLTPFEAEMRRRTWALVRMLDVFFSHQVSLPSMISEHDCDTELPRNIHDEEFGPDTKVLPPSRPKTEATAVSYMIAKVELCQQLGIILQATGRVKNQVHYDEILRFDAKLRETRAEMSPHLRMQPLEGSQAPLTLVMARFNTDILYLKVMCLLHRKYIPRARHNPRYAHSRRAAIEASLETLRHLATLHRESQPNGRLHSVKWFFTMLATKDFLLPAMLIALDLHFDNVGQESAGQQDAQSLYFWTREQRQEMISSLELTRDVWKGLADVSIEAVKASNTLDIMLAKIKSFGGADGPMSSAERSTASGPYGATGPAEMQPEHSAAMTLGMLSGGAMSGASGAFNGAQTLMGAMYGAHDLNLDTANGGSSPSTGPNTSIGIGSVTAPESFNPMLGFDGAQSPLTMFDNLASSNMNLSSNFDWDSFENYTQNANWGGESLQFFSGNPEQSQQQAQPDGALFPYGLDMSGTS